MNVHELLNSLGNSFATTANVKNVYGEPVVAGDRTVIPIAEVRYGFGGGGGTKHHEREGGGGGGGGVIARPAGALVITPESTHFIAFEDKRKLGIALALGFVLGVFIASRRK